MKPTPYFWMFLIAFLPLAFGCAGKSPAQEPSGKAAMVTQNFPGLKTENLTPNHLALAKNLVEKEFYDVALVQLQTAIKERGADAMVYDLAGVCARETGDHKTSEIYLKKARSLSPDNASVHNNLGILYSATNEPKKAGQSFRQAVILDPAMPDYMNNLGYFHLNQKQYTQAEEYFKKALDLDPDHGPALNNLIISLGLQYKDNQAMDLLLSRQDEDTAWHNMACIYTMRNQPEKAKKLLDFVRTNQRTEKGSAFDIQARKGQTPGAKDPGMSGDVADLIYTKKFKTSMKSDPKGISSSSGGK